MQKKVAVLSDVHGDVTALKAVIADSIKQGTDEYWFLGDLILPGPGSADLFDLITGLQPTVWLRGNWEDSYLQYLSGDVNLTDPGDVHFARIAQRLDRKLRQSDVDKMAQLPISQTLESNGLRFGLSHNLPNKNNGRELFPTNGQQNFDQLFEFDRDLDVAVYGHIHQPLMTYSTKGQLIINPGSIGQPFDFWPKLWADLRAQYVMLTLGDGTVEVEFRKVAYDVETELNLAKTVHLPYFELYKELRETGRTHTHDVPLLAELNEKYGYVDEVRDYLKKQG